MFNWAIFAALICFAAVLISLPFYCRESFKGKTQKTLIQKMLQSSLFILAFVFCIVATHNTYPFVFVMLAGFVLSAVGDYFLGKGESSKMFLIGASVFALAHAAYITAFSWAAYRYFRVNWFNSVDIPVYFLLLSALAIICLMKKPRHQKIFKPMIAYFLVLCLMVTKAFGLGFRLAVSHSLGAMLLPLGAVLFLLSDTTLSMMRFKMTEKSLFMKSLSSSSYFIGQLCMAMSLLFMIV